MNRKKILVVDDEKDLVVILEARLEAAGYEVIAAFDGAQALEKVKEKKPDLILLDVMMPKMDGYQVCRLLKFDEKSKEIPVIMLTARGQPGDKKLGQQVGVDDYMVKPFENEELLRKIETWLK